MSKTTNGPDSDSQTNISGKSCYSISVTVKQYCRTEASKEAHTHAVEDHHYRYYYHQYKSSVWRGSIKSFGNNFSFSFNLQECVIVNIVYIYNR